MLKMSDQRVEALAQVRIAVMASAEARRQALAKQLSDRGVNVVCQLDLNLDDFRSIQGSNIHALIVDLIEKDESNETVIDALYDIDDIPVLFHDSSSAGVAQDTGMLWAKHLVDKLEKIVPEHPVSVGDVPTLLAAVAEVEPEVPTLEPVSSQKNVPALHDVVEQGQAEQEVEPLQLEVIDDAVLKQCHQGIKSVWILAASIGGPLALKRFLGEVKQAEPMAIVVAQHIGGSFVSILAEQLRACSVYPVKVMEDGERLQAKQILVVPSDQDFSMNKHGYIRLQPRKTFEGYLPCIDRVVAELLPVFHTMMNMIVFTGMGDDGAQAANMVSRSGGRVWVQEPKSCVVGTMPKKVIEQGIEHFKGTPEALAEKFIEYGQLQSSQSSIPGTEATY